MKKLVSCLLFCLIVLGLYSPTLLASQYDSNEENTASGQSLTYNQLENTSSEPALDLDLMAPPSSNWSNILDGLTPAAFSPDKVSYQLNEKVMVINQISSGLADMGQILSDSDVQKQPPNKIIEKGGYIRKSLLDNALGMAVPNDTIIVDEAAGTAFKVTSPTVYSDVFGADPELGPLVQALETTYTVTQPQLHEVIDDFELKEDTVTLNKANISMFANNVENSVVTVAVDDEDKRFKYLTGDNLIELDFKDATALQGKVGNSRITVTLSGGFAVDAMQVTGRYSRGDGYELSMKLKQESYLIATLDAEVHEEIRVPLFGIDIPFGIGSVYGGIFAIIGMDGSIRLDIEARETTGVKMGVRGGTFLYVPTSFHPIFEPDVPQITGDCGMNGRINGYIKLGPMLGVELLGFDLVGAGVLLGAGVIVESDGSMLDIELYASIEVYLTIADKRFNLMRARPTIYKKQQPDMHGYRVGFLETYISPGRVGGLIEKEPTATGAAYEPSVGVQYRVWIVPRSSIDDFSVGQRETLLQQDIANSEKLLKNKVRTYPETGFAQTNDEGEFFEEKQEICFDGDQVWLEFIAPISTAGDMKTFFVGPATPILPFTDITITYADLFNDYITGKVEPKRVIDWEADRLDPDEIQTELVYYEGPIKISPFNDWGMYAGKHPDYILSGTAFTVTNAKGEFDTRNPYDFAGVTQPSGVIDVLEISDQVNVYYENGEQKTAPVLPPPWIGVKASLWIEEDIKNWVLYGLTPSLPDFQITRTLEEVEDSYSRRVEGNKVINRMQYDESLWIANPNGLRAVTADMLSYEITGFSSQDLINPVATTREGDFTLQPVLDKNGDPTGTAVIKQRISTEWVWQEHPNPIKINSAAETTVEAGLDSTFQVEASGYLPKYSLIGAPQRVWIDENNGLLHITPTVSPGVYTFTVHVEEGIAVIAPNMPDPKQGHDASPPQEQSFTLTVTESTVVVQPSVTPTPTPTPTPPSEPESSVSPTPTATPAPLPQPPLIKVDEYNTYFVMDGTADLSVPFTASGTAPISWSVITPEGRPAPQGVSIDAATGVLTVLQSLLSGTYSLNVEARNAYGYDVHSCTMIKGTVPVLANRRDNYEFSMAQAQTDFTVQFTAQGSFPLSYSLEPIVSESGDELPLPEEISIDSGTGLLSVKGGLIGGIAPGVYDFVLKVQNPIGSDTQICKLTVTKSWLPVRTLKQPAVPLENVALSAVMTSPADKPQSLVTTPAGYQGLVTLRCDDPKDVYTRDRDWINGAAYIHWNTRLELTAATARNLVYFDGSQSMTGINFIKFGEIIIMQDNTPVCDQYHYYAPGEIDLPLTEEEAAEMKANLKQIINEELAIYKNGYEMIQPIGVDDLRDQPFNVNPNFMDEIGSLLNYGDMVDQINNGKGGDFQVALDEATGTVISEAYFTALKGNPEASLSFTQPGFGLTFRGSSVTGTQAGMLYDIGLSKAAHEQTMLDSIGEGFESFSYGFNHHGALPGTASFAINTPLATGSKVNVYRFDAAEGRFTLIAQDLTVGEQGLVTYQNNSMSEYVITTKTIAGAAVAILPEDKPQTSRSYLVWIIAGVALLLVAAGAVWFLRKKKTAGT